MLGSRTQSPDAHVQQREPQTTAKPAHNHRIWVTPLLTEQMGKVFISDGICLPHTRLEPIMLKILPIILSRISQNFHLLFFFYSFV